MDGGSARYDEVADAYAAMFGDAVDDPATSALLELLGPVRATRLLDVPCGQGRVARELVRRGATVVAVDISEALLERARAAEGENAIGITYLRADVTEADALAGEAFDTVVCNYGLSDIDDIDGMLDMVARVLRPGGAFVFSILHPCFPGWGEDVSASWPRGGYYEEGWWRAEGSSSDLRRQVGSNHRMLSTYLNALVSRGFVIERVAEPAPPWDLPGVDLVPMFFAVRCRNP
jgi:ubiquinone/menaquinone biosynthesis C-methylase UbiE